MAIQSSGLPQWLSGKEWVYNAGAAGDVGLIPGAERSPGTGPDRPLQYSWASLCGSAGKESACNGESWVQSLAWEDLLDSRAHAPQQEKPQQREPRYRN